MLLLLLPSLHAVAVLVNPSTGPASPIPNLGILDAIVKPPPSVHGLTCSVVLQVSQHLGSQDIRDQPVSEEVRLGMSFH